MVRRAAGPSFQDAHVHHHFSVGRPAIVSAAIRRRNPPVGPPAHARRGAGNPTGAVLGDGHVWLQRSETAGRPVTLPAAWALSSTGPGGGARVLLAQGRLRRLGRPSHQTTHAGGERPAETRRIRLEAKWQ